MLLVFREEKSHDDEIKAWQFWHSRQHSIKQRILDADTKNSSGIIGPIEEVTHNSISFYWNPLEGPAKVRLAVVMTLTSIITLSLIEIINNRSTLQCNVFPQTSVIRKE
jgi:transcription factor CP2-like protein